MPTFSPGPGASDDPCAEDYRGPSAQSEIEVKNIADFIMSHGNFKSFMTLHSYKQLLMYPYAYSGTDAPDRTELVRKSTPINLLGFLNLVCFMISQWYFLCVFFFSSMMWPHRQAKPSIPGMALFIKLEASSTLSVSGLWKWICFYHLPRHGISHLKV